MEFKKNKRYHSCLNKEKEDYWVDSNPLFMHKNKGLFPVYRANGKYGIMNKHYHELILKDIPKEVLEGINYKAKPNKTTKNVLEFDEKKHFKEDKDELFKGL